MTHRIGSASFDGDRLTEMGAPPPQRQADDNGPLGSLFAIGLAGAVGCALVFTLGVWAYVTYWLAIHGWEWARGVLT